MELHEINRCEHNDQSVCWNMIIAGNTDTPDIPLPYIFREGADELSLQRLILAFEFLLC